MTHYYSLIRSSTALVLVFSISFTSTLHALPGSGDEWEVGSNLSSRSPRGDINNNNNNNIDNENIKLKPPLPNKSDRQETKTMDPKNSEDSPSLRSYSHSAEDKEVFENSSHNQVSDNQLLGPEEYEIFRTQALFLLEHNIFACTFVGSHKGLHS